MYLHDVYNSEEKGTCRSCVREGCTEQTNGAVLVGEEARDELRKSDNDQDRQKLNPENEKSCVTDVTWAAGVGR